MATDSDPRVYFAAERTLLAWLRTGLAVMGLGFLVARFGLFLQLIRQPAADVHAPLPSSLIGTGFVVLGALMIALATWQHARFCRRLAPSQLPPHYWRPMGIAVAALVALLGMALAIYLLQSLPLP